ncbi:hypothetical protein [uncultured Pseudomonas sp.]|uniref:hypothetical protein n=1 Tax=uncultured Pseudomonas sp. TaxID=114707 RepID=UPI0025CD1B21|nr:hypothetical protein [uncultured Pseudomonas sp.]
MSAPDFVARVGELDSLLAFYASVPTEYRDDIQDVLLYAQLFASHLNDFQGQWHNWMHYYRDRLESHGFVRQNLVIKDAVLLSSVSDFETASFRLASSVASAEVSALVRGAVRWLGIRDMATAYFRGGGFSESRGSMQIVPCEMTIDGLPSLMLCALRVGVDHGSAGMRRLVLHFKGGSYRFEPQRYAARRASVQAYLAGKSHAVIRAFDPSELGLLAP